MRQVNRPEGSAERDCHTPSVPSASVGGSSGFEAFYRDALWELHEHARKGGTAIGFAAVLRRLAHQHGQGEFADRVPLPRWTRTELEDGRAKRSKRRKAF